MRFTVLRSKDDSCQICDSQHKPIIVNYMLTTRQWEIQNSMFRMPIIQALKTMVRIIESNIM